MAGTAITLVMIFLWLIFCMAGHAVGKFIMSDFCWQPFFYILMTGITSSI
jgi:hypothetical protein